MIDEKVEEKWSRRRETSRVVESYVMLAIFDTTSIYIES